MKILGINYYFEHPAVSLIIDGELVFAIEDERLTRIKHGKSYTPYKTYLPIDAIYAALKSQNLTSSDIDEITLSYNKWDHLKSLLGCVLLANDFHPLEKSYKHLTWPVMFALF